MRASDLMTSPVIVVQEDASLEEAARLMIERSVGGLPVVDATGRVTGFITDSDFAAKRRGIPFSLVKAPQVLGEWLGRDDLDRIYADARARRVREAMSAPPITAQEDEPVDAIVRRLLEHDINRIVITRNGKPVGIVARHDLLRMVLQRGSA